MYICKHLKITNITRETTIVQSDFFTPIKLLMPHVIYVIKTGELPESGATIVGGGDIFALSQFVFTMELLFCLFIGHEMTSADPNKNQNVLSCRRKPAVE